MTRYKVFFTVLLLASLSMTIVMDLAPLTNTIIISGAISLYIVGWSWIFDTEEKQIKNGTD